MHGDGPAIEEGQSDRNLQLHIISHKAMAIPRVKTSLLSFVWTQVQICRANTVVVGMAETHADNGHHNSSCDGPGYNTCSVSSPI